VTAFGATGWDVFPLCLGTNVFGWTADRRESFAVLDAYVASGGNFLDTADQYAAFAPGLRGGESETIIGEWLAARGRRDDVLLATKVGRKPGREGLAASNVRRALTESLTRLQTDYVDLLYAHADDPRTPLTETLGAFDDLVREGLVRQIAASNYTAERLAEALAVSRRQSLTVFAALQCHYSLLARDEYEDGLRELCMSAHLPCVPYWGLARGFLTGKYRPGGDPVPSPRARAASAHLDDRGLRVLAALDEVAASHRVAPAAVALGWLAAQPGIVSPLASARTPEQLRDLLQVTDLELSDGDVNLLDDASRT
jgi:aryl-alcohol dehydrogenase-like predicted oxidoreductase